MSTNRSFGTMLNEYVTFDLLMNEYVKRDFLFNKLEKDIKHKGGSIPVPFVAGLPSSVAFGGLVAEDDISEMQTARGTISSFPEVWGSLLFHQRDLWEHDKISEQNFLRILPDQIDGMMDYMKSVVSQNLLTGKHFATLTADGTVGGVITVDHPDRFQLGQAVYVDDNNSAPVKGYVRAIDIGAKTITLYDARTGGAVVDVSGYATAQTARVYLQGAQTDSLTSLRDAVLSAANGGATTLYGVTKTTYPYLAGTQIDGTGITATNLLDKLFDAYLQHRQYASGNARELLISYKHFGTILKLLESTRGAYNIVPGSNKASVYGWDTITIGGKLGDSNGLTINAIREMDDDLIFLLDYKSMKIVSNGLFRKRQNPDTGSSFYELRTTSGYKYIVDIALFGELVVYKPQANGVIYGISY
jgi:hypothetical protein